MRSLRLGLDATLSRDEHHRVAEPADAAAISAVLGEAFEGYRSWAPSDWAPPVLTPAGVARFADALGRSDVWCLLALDDERVIGYVALSLFSMEDPTAAGRHDQSVAAVRETGVAGPRDRDMAHGCGSQRNPATRLHADAPMEAAGPESSPTLL